MEGNNSIFVGEKSFFGTNTFNKEETNNQKDGTKNSSNPEKEYER